MMRNMAASDLSSMTRKVNSRFEANESVEELLDYFDHDINKLLVFLGTAFKNKKPVQQQPLNMFVAPASKVDDGPVFNWWNSDFGSQEEYSWESMFTSSNQPFALYQRSMDDILGDIDQYEMDLGEEKTVEDEMIFMQEERRRQSVMGLQKRLSEADGGGRRLSRMDAKNIMLDSAYEIAAQEEQEDEVLASEEAVAEEEEPEPEFLYLPYVPIQGDEVDEAVAELVNSRELDVHISRPDAVDAKKKKKKGNKRVYKVAGVSYTVRCIHGLLIAKADDSTKWDEFEPVLKKVYGDMDAALG